MKQLDRELKIFIWRIAFGHTIAYFIAGVISMFVLDYETLFNEGVKHGLRPFDSPWIAAGAGLQVIRGVLLSLFLLPFRRIFTDTKFGWLKFWSLSFGLIYFLTFAPPAGSFEGLIYTTHSWKMHLLPLGEMLLYISIFSGILWYSYKKQSKAIDYLLLVLTVFVVLMSIAGVLQRLHLLGD